MLEAGGPPAAHPSGYAVGTVEPSVPLLIGEVEPQARCMVVRRHEVTAAVRRDEDRPIVAVPVPARNERVQEEEARKDVEGLEALGPLKSGGEPNPRKNSLHRGCRECP